MTETLLVMVTVFLSGLQWEYYYLTEGIKERANMKTKERQFLFLIAGLFLLLATAGGVSPASAADVRIVGNPSVPGDTIDQATLKDIFLGKKTTWDNGESIEFVTLNDGDTHSAFLAAYINKTPSQFSSFWKQQVFTGKGKMPKSFESEGALLEYVTGKAGAIGYISAADPGSAKTITVK